MKLGRFVRCFKIHNSATRSMNQNRSGQYVRNCLLNSTKPLVAGIRQANMNYPLSDNDYNRLPFHLATRLVNESKRTGLAMASAICPKCKHAPAVYKWHSNSDGNDCRVECTNCHAVLKRERL